MLYDRADQVHEHIADSNCAIDTTQSIRKTYREVIFGDKFRKNVKQFALVALEETLYEYYQFFDGSEIYVIC